MQRSTIIAVGVGLFAVGGFIAWRLARAAGDAAAASDGAGPIDAGASASDAPGPSFLDSVLEEVQVTAEYVGLKDAPRGIRNNNPGNLDFLPAGHAWNGQVGSDGRYGIYDTPANGVRAMSKQLQKDFARAGGATLRDLVTSWAPPGENDTEAYIAAVSRETGIAPDDQFDLTSSLPSVVTAMIRHENGEQPYSPDDIRSWVYLA